MDAETVAMSTGRPVKVQLMSRRMIPILGILGFTMDNPPKINNTITPEHQRNRKSVKSGKIVNWTNHGGTAIVEAKSGLQAAYHHHEIEKA
ncbi:MAG: hypothetical protein HRU20_24755 [Pseudomonadales bacterium]|nr:hypothetical protein [Pseudomonadales bacterium]